MSEYKNLYTSPDAGLNTAGGNTLLLQLDVNSYSYAVTAGNNLLNWAVGHAIESLADDEQLRNLLSGTYTQVVVGLRSAGFTLLPKSFFEEDKISQIARLLDVSAHDKVSAQAVDEENVMVYKFNGELVTAVSQVNAGLNFAEAGWIKAIAQHYPLNRNLYININGDSASFLNFSNGKLRFYNAFKFNSHEELGYYCALVTTELELNPQDTRLVISGDVNATDRYFTYLSEFFSEVTLNTQQLLNLPAGVDAHQILGLSALLLCASSEGN